MGWFSNDNDDKSGVQQQSQTERDNMTTSDIRDHQIVTNFGDVESAREHGAPVRGDSPDPDGGGSGNGGWFGGWFR